jgi:hypothetical protein
VSARKKAPASQPRMKTAEPTVGTKLHTLAMQAMGIGDLERDDNPALTALDNLIPQIEILGFAVENFRDGVEPEDVSTIVWQIKAKVEAIRELVVIAESKACRAG